MAKDKVALISENMLAAPRAPIQVFQAEMLQKLVRYHFLFDHSTRVLILNEPIKGINAALGAIVTNYCLANSDGQLKQYTASYTSVASLGLLCSAPEIPR